MKVLVNSLRSFRTKVTVFFILAILFSAGVGNFILYKYSLDSQLNQLRDKLKIIAQVSALAIDANELMKIPLEREGIKSGSYKVISGKLKEIKDSNPLIKYIYTMARSKKEGILQFIVDPGPVSKNKKGLQVTAYPGDEYDARSFPQMFDAFYAPVADKRLGNDEWGVFLSGYAPIRNKQGDTVAILGVDIAADDVYLSQVGLYRRGIAVLILGLFLAFGLGFTLSGRVTKPIRELLIGTKRISRGDLGYRVKVSGSDEIAQLGGAFNDMTQALTEARKKLDEYFYRVVQSMVRSLEAKDPYTRGHSDRVSEYAQQIAVEMGFPAEKIELLGKAAQLHDIGKLGVHEDILNKKGPLSDSEWDILHQHPASGEEILKPVFLDLEMLSVIRSHHEHFDGSGYPDKLKAKEINIFAQIASVADAYDAMTSSRSYRSALSKEDAEKRLREGRGTQFNPEVVDAFIRVLNKQDK